MKDRLYAGRRGLYKKMKVGDFLLFMGKLKGLSRDKCIDSAADWFENLEVSNWWKKNIEDLSKGMSQKFNLFQR